MEKNKGNNKKKPISGNLFDLIFSIDDFKPVPKIKKSQYVGTIHEIMALTDKEKLSRLEILQINAVLSFLMNDNRELREYSKIMEFMVKSPMPKKYERELIEHQNDIKQLIDALTYNATTRRACLYMIIAFLKDVIIEDMELNDGASKYKKPKSETVNKIKVCYDNVNAILQKNRQIIGAIMGLKRIFGIKMDFDFEKYYMWNYEDIDAYNKTISELEQQLKLDIASRKTTSQTVKSTEFITETLKYLTPIEYKSFIPSPELVEWFESTRHPTKIYYLSSGIIEE